MKKFLNFIEVKLLKRLGLVLIVNLLTLLFFLPLSVFAVIKYKGIQPGKTSKDEVTTILGEPTNEINSSSYEYRSPIKKRIEKVVIEYKTVESKPIVDKIDLLLIKPVDRSAQTKKDNLPDNPKFQGENSEGKFEEYYGSTKSVMLTYQSKTPESGIKIISYLSRERFESMSKEFAKNTVGPKQPSTGEEPKKPNGTEPKKQTEVASIPTEAKQHLQQGMTYASLAQTNPKTKSENYDNAIIEFTNAIEVNQDYAEAYSNRGVAYMQQKKYNKAERDLIKASELKPDDPVIQYNLAALYSLQKKIDLSLDSLDMALENGFNNYDALKPRGKHSDPDLKNLRKDPEFKKVLEKHKVFILK